MNEKVLTIDIGTTSCKTAVFDAKGDLIAKAEMEYKIYSDRWAMIIASKAIGLDSELKPNKIVKEFTPQKESKKVYDKYYYKYNKIYDLLKDIF